MALTEEEKRLNELTIRHMKLDSIFNGIVAFASVATFLTVMLRYRK